MKPAVLRTLVLVAIPAIHVLVVALQIATRSQQIADISWKDVYAEGLLTVIAFIWLVIITKTFPKRNVFIPLYIGSYIFLLGMFEDVADELFDFSPLLGITSYENILWIGMALVAAGLYIWSKYLVNKDDLLTSNEQLDQTKSKLEVSNAELETHKKELEQRNMDLEKALDDFYTMRVGMAKQMAEGTYEKENERIRQRLEELRQKK